MEQSGWATGTPVEKVPKQIPRRDAEKSDLIECAIINDFILVKRQVAPERTVPTRPKDFFYKLGRHIKNRRKPNGDIERTIRREN